MVEEIAPERRCDPLDAVCDVIIADKGATRIVVRSMSEADIRAIAADPSVLVGSDGPCVAPYGITGQGKPHPRLYGMIWPAHRAASPFEALLVKLMARSRRRSLVFFSTATDTCSGGRLT